MPKSRRQAGTVFAVSPWHSKQEHDVDGDNPHPIAEAGYSVVELPLVVGGSGGGAAPIDPATSQDAQPDAMAVEPSSNAAASHAHDDQQAAAAVAAAAEQGAAPPAAAQALGGGWRTKKRKVDVPEEAGMQAQEAGAASVGVEDDPLLAAAADDDDSGGQEPAPPLQLAGTAYLALLPNGSITGHLVCQPSVFGTSRRRSFGVMGEVVVAGRECTRDADWGVLRVTLVSFGGSSGDGGGGSGGSGGEVSFLAERTEGDAMCLRAPVPWQGIELEELPALDATCTCASASGLTLHFSCQQLLTGPAADALLRRLQPSLAGRGAVANVGDMKVSLPPEAAAVLVPDAAARQAGQPGGRSGSSAPREQQQQQGLYTGSGSGRGRAVQDSGDDW